MDQRDDEREDELPPALIPGEDYYINDKGLWVFTASYLLRRGHCCQSGCLHCPYGFSKLPIEEY